MDMKNLWRISCLLCYVFCFFPSTIYAEEYDEENKPDNLNEEVIDQLQIAELQQYWNELGHEYGSFIKELESKSIIDMIKNNEQISLKSIAKGLMSFLLYEIISNGKLLGTLIVLTIFATILQTMLTAFEKSTINKIANFVILLVLLYITLQTFYIAINYAKDAVEMMSNFIIALFPLMLGIIASLGQFTQVAFFHPIIILLIHFSGLLLSKFVFPLLYLSALLVIMSEINEQFKATHLAQLIRTISLALLGIYISVFLTILSIQGTASAIQDGVALKTTKFIASNFIPVIGQTLTDAADTILSAGLLLKNAIGIVGLLIIVLYAVFPAIKIAVLAFIYKLVAGLLQPLGSNHIIKSLNTISQYMIYILACLFGITFTFFLTIVIIVAASNIPILLR